MSQVDRLKWLEQKLVAVLPIGQARGRRTKGRLAFRYGVLVASLVKAREALQAVLEDEGHTR